MTNKTIKLAFVACCGLYLGACGKDAPSVDDLISKYNQARTCANKSTVTFTQTQKDSFNSACNSDDRKALGAAADCDVSVLCDKAAASSCNNTAGVTLGCAAFFSANGLPRFDAAQQ